MWGWVLSVLVFLCSVFAVLVSEPAPSCETGTSQKAKRSKKSKKGAEQLTAEEEAELERQKVRTFLE